MTSCGLPMQQEINELGNFPNAVDGVNIVIAQSQDTSESESQ